MTLVAEHYLNLSLVTTQVLFLALEEFYGAELLSTKVQTNKVEIEGVLETVTAKQILDAMKKAGSTVSINYVSGSTGKLQQMSLSKKSMKSSSRCVFIDDFMKAGGTALGIKDLLKEFDSELVGIGVLVDNKEIKKKLIDQYVSIVEFDSVENGVIAGLKPSSLFE